MTGSDAEHYYRNNCYDNNQATELSMTIDKNQISLLNQKKKSPTESVESKHSPKPTQGFDVGDRQTGSERTSLVIDRHNLDLLDEHTLRIKKALRRRSINRSVLTRAAISHFNQLSPEEQLTLVENVL